MKAIAIRLIAAAVAGLALFAAWQYVRALQADLQTARQEARTAKQGNAERDETIKLMNADARAAELARVKLEGQRDGIRLALAEREQQFRRLLNENAALRAWSDTDLPPDVIRLHEHGPIVGAEAYRQANTDRDAVHAVVRDTEKKR